MVLDMTVEEGIKMVVSGGIVTPPDRRPPTVRDVPAISTRLGGVGQAIEAWGDEVAARDSTARARDQAPMPSGPLGK